jgi:hypothetical protein
MIIFYKFTSYMTAVLGNRRNIIPLLATLVIIPFYTTGCSCSSQTTLYFPVQKEPQTTVLIALLSGQLVSEDGYLKVKDELIIWPYGYSMKQDKNEIWIYNEKSQMVFKAGDVIQIGGGEVSISTAEEKIGKQLPTDIEGPFWLAGNIEKK